MRRAKGAKEFYLRNIFLYLVSYGPPLATQDICSRSIIQSTLTRFFFFNQWSGLDHSTKLQSSQAKICFLSFMLVPRRHRGRSWWLTNSASITVYCHWPRSTMERFGQMEWFQCISKVITAKFHWFSRYKHLAVKINKLLHPYNYRLPLQMQLKWIPAHLECCDDVSKWSFLLF